MAKQIDNNWTAANTPADGLFRTNPHAEENATGGIHLLGVRKLADFDVTPFYTFTVAGGGTQITFTAQIGYQLGTLEFYKWQVEDHLGNKAFGTASLLAPTTPVVVDTSGLNSSAAGYNWSIIVDIGLRDGDGALNRVTHEFTQPISELSGNPTTDVHFEGAVSGVLMEYDSGVIAESILQLMFAGKNVVAANEPYTTAAGQGEQLVLDLIALGKNPFVVAVAGTSLRVIVESTEVFNGVQISTGFVRSTPGIDTAYTYVCDVTWVNPIEEIFVNGAVLALANYPYTPNMDEAQLETDLIAAGYATATASFGGGTTTITIPNTTDVFSIATANTQAELNLFTRS